SFEVAHATALPPRSRAPPAHRPVARRTGRNAAVPALAAQRSTPRRCVGRRVPAVLSQPRGLSAKRLEPCEPFATPQTFASAASWPPAIAAAPSQYPTPDRSDQSGAAANQQGRLLPRVGRCPGTADPASAQAAPGVRVFH